MKFTCPQCGKADAIEAKMVGHSREHVVDGQRVIDEWTRPEIVSKHCSCITLRPDVQFGITTTVTLKWWDDIAGGRVTPPRIGRTPLNAVKQVIPEDQA